MDSDAHQFAVVDLETTGLFARGNDRIVEIAAVRLDQDGEFLDEFCTLVNPGRDIGPTRIHGIEAWEVVDAPTMNDIVGDIASRLNNRVAVAHNAMFDLGFLSAEFSRVGYPLPEIRYLCTLEMAAAWDGDIPSHKLEALCEYFDVPLPQAHSAIDDARATAMLLSILLRASRRQQNKAAEHLPFRMLPGEGKVWPTASPCGKSCLRGQQRSPSDRGADLVSRLISRLPYFPNTDPGLQAYLVLLDEVLEDRRVTPDESEKLFELAVSLGLDRNHVMTAHADYVQRLVSVALEDQVLSEFESRDLSSICQILSISDAALKSMIQAAYTQPTKKRKKVKKEASSASLKGCLICFTGEFRGSIDGKPIERGFAEKLAADRGMVVKCGVSRKLDVLVAADPDSNSGKAKKAREYGIRIISEAQFWKLMEIQVE